MKTKNHKQNLIVKLNLIIGLILYSNSFAYAQSNLSKDNQAIADNFIDREMALIVNTQTIAEKERLIFKEFKKLEPTDVEKLKVSFPTYLLVNTKVKPGKEVKQIITDETVYTDLIFDFSDTNYIVFEDSKTSINHKFIYNYLEFSDLIVSKYITEKTNEIYYSCKLKYGNEIYYGFFTDADLNLQKKQENFNFVSQGLEKLNMEKIKNQAKNYLNGYFTKIFPNDEMYLYDVEYELSIAGSDKKVNFSTTAISNSKDNNLTIDDFYSSTKQKPLNFKYKSTINIYNLIANPIFIDSIYTIKNLSVSSYRYWDNDDIDARISEEARLIKKDINNINKFDYNYFANKFKNPTYLKGFSKTPYILRAKDDFKFEFNDFYSKYNVEAAMLSLSTNGTEVIFKYTPKSIETYGYMYAEYNFTPKSIERKFDTRIDSLNFKFVFVDPLLLTESRQYHSQKSPEKLIDYNIKECLISLNGYAAYLKENNKQDQVDNKNKEILYGKYGKKYVDEAIKGNIIVGMHEDLLEIPLRLWAVDRKTNSNSTQTFYFHSKIDSSAKMSVSITNKKVSNVYTW